MFLIFSLQCYECIVRMRVLCDRKECPICRHTLNKVICTNNETLFEKNTQRLKEFDYNDKYEVYFETEDIKNQFFKTFENSCLM